MHGEPRMTPAEIEAALRVAFDACTTEGYPLSLEQQALLLQLVTQQFGNGESSSTRRTERPGAPESADALSNPLEDLTVEQRLAFLQYVREAQEGGRSWKAQLLNDWLRGDDSGSVQFVRDQFGLSWLERVQPIHLAAYADATRRLKVGDRIEVANSLWEWVQDDGPCSREWFPCTVVALSEPAADEGAADTTASPETQQARCCVRFDNGMEYEIQGIYEWNRYNWRWIGEGAEL